LKPETAVCIVLASHGYPDRYETGKAISGVETAAKESMIFHAGTKNENGQFLTSGGRVLGVTTLGNNLRTAIGTAYDAVRKVSFEGVYYRNDIGKKGLT